MGRSYGPPGTSRRARTNENAGINLPSKTPVRLGGGGGPLKAGPSTAGRALGAKTMDRNVLAPKGDGPMEDIGGLIPSLSLLANPIQDRNGYSNQPASHLAVGRRPLVPCPLAYSRHPLHSALSAHPAHSVSRQDPLSLSPVPSAHAVGLARPCSHMVVPPRALAAPV